MDVLYSLLLNIGLLSLAAVGVFIFNVSFDLPIDSKRRGVVAGCIYGATSVLVVNFPIEGPLGSSFDTRAAPVLIAAYYGGPIGGIVSACVGAIARYHLGGPAALGGALSFFLYAAAGYIARTHFKKKPINAPQLVLLGIFGTVLVTPSFFIGQPITNGLKILQTFWHVLLGGNLIGTVLLGLIVGKMHELISAQREIDAILSSSPDGIVTVSSNFLVQSMNPAAVRLFGWTEKELVGKPVEYLIPINSRKNHGANARSFLLNDGTQFREMTGFRIVEALKKDGRPFPVLVSLAKYISNGELMVAATVHDMTEMMVNRQKLEAMTEKLAYQLGEARAANDSKNRFLANMSHELRTPLNAVIGFSGMLCLPDREELESKTVKEYAADIKYSGETLLAMINDILDISKIEIDQTEMEISNFQAASVIEGALTLVETSARDKEIRILTDGNTGIIGRCDLRSSIQVLTNLLTNAIKFSPGNSPVIVSVESDPANLKIIVEDHGPGVPDEIIQRLGEPFLRGDNPEIRKTEGTGLGLALSKKLAERQNGHLELTRTATGTRATMFMPLGVREIAPVAESIKADPAIYC